MDAKITRKMLRLDIFEFQTRSDLMTKEVKKLTEIIFSTLTLTLLSKILQKSQLQNQMNFTTILSYPTPLFLPKKKLNYQPNKHNNQRKYIILIIKNYKTK